MRYNLHRCAQLNVSGKEAYSTYQVMAVLQDVFAKTMPREMGFDYKDMSFQEQQAQKGVPPAVIFGILAAVRLLDSSGPIRKLDFAV